MEDGKVPPDLFSLSDNESDVRETGSNFVISSGGRLGGSLSDVVDLAAAVPEEDEAVQSVASRFRKNQVEIKMDAASLDEQDVDTNISDTELQSFILDALDPEEEEIEEPPALEIDEAAETQKTDLNDLGGSPSTADDRPASGIICPSCAALNPPGMRYCVQCGGGLSTVSKSGVLKAPKKTVPPSTDRARKENPWPISLISINEDGSDGVEIPLEFLETTIGRDGDTRFPTDAFLSPKHARFHVEEGVMSIEDLYSLNGTFLKLRDEVKLSPGDTFLMGRQVLRFERFEQSITPKTKSADGTRYMGSPSPGGSHKVLQIGIGGVVQNVYCLPESGAVLGREKGDIIFPHDKFMSSRHAQIYTGDDGHCYLVDLNSSNGTWIKIWEKTKLHDNDFIFMGQQLFRVKQKK